MTLHDQPWRTLWVESGMREQVWPDNRGLDAGAFGWGAAAVIQEP